MANFITDFMMLLSSGISIREHWQAVISRFADETIEPPLQSINGMLPANSYAIGIDRDERFWVVR